MLMTDILPVKFMWFSLMQNIFSFCQEYSQWKFLDFSKDLEKEHDKSDRLELSFLFNSPKFCLFH